MVHLKKKVDKLLKKVTKCKTTIATERDKLRELHGDLTDILESLDGGIDGVENSLREFEDAVDKMSEYL